MTPSLRLGIVALATLFLAVARADEPEKAAGPASPLDDYNLGAALTAGYRFVDVGGSEQKYREDYNLRQGVRLFNFDVSAAAKDTTKSSLDHFHLLVDTPGDEPVSTYLLDAGDRERWDFRANFTRSKYFYDVPALFENPVPGDSKTSDLHSFDLIRTNGAVDFTLHLPKLPKLFLGYRLYRQEGDTTSTINVDGGDTFLVRAPIDSRTHVAVIGTEFDALGTNVFVQQQYRRTIRDLGDHGPRTGEAQGLDPNDTSTLAHYDAFGSEHIDEPVTTVRVRRPIGERFELTGGYFFSHADLSSDWTTSQNATTNVPALPGFAQKTQHGDATLDTNIADLGATARITDHFSAHATYRFDEQWQQGGFEQSGSVGVLSIGTGHHVRLHRLTGDFEWDPRRDLTFRLGLRYSWRLADFSSSGIGPITTQTLGAIADARWRPSSKVDLFARYESAQVDDPYVVQGEQLSAPPLPAREITLTFRNRSTAGATIRPLDWMSIGYRFVADSRENDTFAARSLAFGNSATVTLTPFPNLAILAAYTRRDLDDQADIAFAPTYFPTRATQAGSEDVLTSQVTYDFQAFGKRWSTGGHVFWVNSDQHWSPRFETTPDVATLFELSRIDGGLFLTFRHPWIEPSVEFRVIDYDERVLPKNNYSATIVSMTFTKRFGTAAAP
jgi:hypothetical protein